MQNSRLKMPEGRYILRYDAPVEMKNIWDEEAWNHAFPIGNGNMGMMIHTQVGQDKLALNEDTIWYGGGGRNRVNPKARDNYLTVRSLLTEGRTEEAQRLAFDTMLAVPDEMRNYSTAQNVLLKVHEDDQTQEYVRYLDLERAVAVVEYVKDGVHYKREHFASAVHHCMIIRMTSTYEDGSRAPVMNPRLILGWRYGAEYLTVCGENALEVTCNPGGMGGMNYNVMALATSGDGEVSVRKDAVCVQGASELVYYLTIRTEFYGDDIHAWALRTLTEASALSYDELLNAHIKEYQLLFNRMDLHLAGDPETERLPIDRRLARLDGDETDPGLAALYFMFGRYLMISSSRPGSQPANLQGIWNKDEHPAWGSKYTININTEMNYWMAEACNLAECHEPLFDLMDRMLENGKKVARDMYGLDGFVCHHNTDIYGDCAPQDSYMPASIWPMGGAWLATHVMRHYEYTLDRDFLKRNLTFMKESCRFFLGYLFEDGNGDYITGPSVSPENSYIDGNGFHGTLCNGPSMDSQILRELFEDYLKAEKILQLSDEIDDEVRRILPRLKKPSVGRCGQIMEWAEDYVEVEPGHRHISQLYGLCPGELFHPERDAKLYEAACKTLERRLENGGGHTGWSRAWIICLMAVLGKGELAGRNVDLLLRRSTSDNLFDMHPPFQIDGNFGACYGISQMLMQSRNGIITLLPALPAAWCGGEVRGLVAKDDILVNITWSDCRVMKAALISKKGRTIVLRMPEGAYHVSAFGNAAACEEDGLLTVTGEGIFGVEIV